MDWWRIVAGFVGFIGVISQMPNDIESWFFGIAFLIIGISGFFDKN